jgi:uncharacterized membrane protein YjfL (UPF0719 family)
MLLSILNTQTVTTFLFYRTISLNILVLNYKFIPLLMAKLTDQGNEPAKIK